MNIKNAEPVSSFFIARIFDVIIEFGMLIATIEIIDVTIFGAILINLTY